MENLLKLLAWIAIELKLYKETSQFTELEEDKKNPKDAIITLAFFALLVSGFFILAVFT